MSEESREELSCYMISDKPGGDENNKADIRSVLQLQVHKDACDIWCR